jgi:hypothetical protein
MFLSILPNPTFRNCVKNRFGLDLIHCRGRQGYYTAERQNILLKCKMIAYRRRNMYFELILRDISMEPHCGRKFNES